MPPNTAPDERRGWCGGSLRVFKHFAWLEVGSVKTALSRLGRAPGWCPIPPTSTPEGVYPLQGATQTRAVGQTRINRLGITS